MNKDWSELNKSMQTQICKKDSFTQGIGTLISLRKLLMGQVMDFGLLPKEKLCAIPFLNADGYHSKTIAYSIYHIFRIEDIVAHTLIKKDGEVFFEKDFQRKMNSPIITTGNELVGQDIAVFSMQLDSAQLFSYANEVHKSSTEILSSMNFDDMKKKFSQDDKQRILDLKVVSDRNEARWLVDYWCGKDIKGLIRMPFSRHWIMHIEASLRILRKIRG